MTPDLPRVTIVDGCRVHGDKPMDAEGYEAVRKIIAAARALFSPVEIVSALPEDVAIDVEALLWCDVCNGPLREDLIEAGEELCDSCFEEASYER